MDSLTQHGRNHTKKYLEAIVFGDELAEFRGDYSALCQPRGPATRLGKFEAWRELIVDITTLQLDSFTIAERLRSLRLST